MAVEEVVLSAVDGVAEHAAPGIHVAISAEHLGTFFGFPITNTLITSWVVIALLVIVA